MTFCFVFVYLFSNSKRQFKPSRHKWKRLHQVEPGIDPSWPQQVAGTLSWGETNHVFLSSLDLCKKVIYCNLLSMSCRGIFSPGHKVERHPGPDRHLGHLQQVGSPGGWTEEKQVFKVKVCYNRLQKQADRHKHTNLKAEERTLFCSFRSTSACEVHQTWNGPWKIVGKKISKTKSYIWIFVDIW